ncbi:MAG: hypothetical protein N2043_01860 [Ignavibacterium sp.]|nr:hypothetical protein [Ignavibacterium sp.]
MRYKIENITTQEWLEVKQNYTKWIESIEIPLDPTTTDIKRINHELDEIYTEVRIHYAYLEYQYEKYMRMYKHAKTSLYLTFKESGKTEKEREALIYDFLEKNPLPGTKIPITVIIEMIEERYLFFKALIDIIKEKSAKMITDSAALKLETNVTEGR